MGSGVGTGVGVGVGSGVDVGAGELVGAGDVVGTIDSVGSADGVETGAGESESPLHIPRRARRTRTTRAGFIHECFLFGEEPDADLEELDLVWEAFEPPIFLLYEIPVPGAETLALAPVRLLKEMPPNLPPILTPALLLPRLNLTPGALLKLFGTENPLFLSPLIF